MTTERQDGRRCPAVLSLTLPGNDDPEPREHCEKSAGHRDDHGTLSGCCWFTSNSDTSSVVASTDQPTNWTCDENGRSNSSPRYNELCREVERLIRGDAHQLIQGRADRTARLVMAQLAHKHNVGPLPVTTDQENEL